ncbi:hypothetical protein [Flexibacterium corallicola]|uniref:hypothetical protein n=1 Tax=Flexibacterium corallicola TaxID=3037259 RepID=UPI00286EF496|nr:hypothetical protein [Pseudovibrio sp. M1P-2-3]
MGEVKFLTNKPVRERDRSTSPDDLLQMGLDCALGRSGPVELVQAHKWFNLAVHAGSVKAIRLRAEVAEQMSLQDISQAQKAARDWLQYQS